jgi:DNA-binding NtrC family response regulator/predicted TIM-barrel enzyme
MSDTMTGTASMSHPIRLVSRRIGPFWSRRSFVVGACIGTGSAARAVKQGGADFVLVGNVGRLRMMGAPSPACHLPLRDSNRMVEEIAMSEILPAVDLPIFFGAAACVPDLDLRSLAHAIREQGFDGICNFPTASEMTGAYRQALERAGVGYQREIEMLGYGKAAGLSVLGYALGRNDVERLAEIEPDMVCVMFDPRLGLTSASSQSELEVAAGLMRPLVDMVRRRAPNALCLFGGAVISSAERMLQLCRLMRADGYIGGSTIDQAPVGRSIEDRVAEFKAVSLARHNVEILDREAGALGTHKRLTAGSRRMRDLYARITREARRNAEILITGDAGTGKTHVSEYVHEVSARRARRLVTIKCGPERASDLEVELFGAVAGVDGATRERIGLLPTLTGCTILFENLEHIPLAVQRLLLDVMERKRARPLGGTDELPADVRIIFTSRRSLAVLRDEGLALEELAIRLQPFSFHLPPLRERIEELPLLADHMLAIARESANPRVHSIEHAAIRYLQHQPWPGNLRMLKSAITEAAFRAREPQISLADLSATSTAQVQPASERERIIDALWRHNFRKAETADFLGVSRKTLYNKMRKYELLSSTPKSGIEHDEAGN